MIEKTGNDLLVIASQPQELVDAQLSIIERVKGLEVEAQTELAEADILIDRCSHAHVDLKRPKMFRKRAESRLTYLSKMREALEAGYVIVPNFPGTTIAVRVKKKTPNSRVVERRNWAPHVPDVVAEILPSGEGRYVNPVPVKDDNSFTETVDGNITTTNFAWATDFQDELVFPVDFLKPTIIEMTGKTMTRKLFDEIAVIDGVPRTRTAFVNNRSVNADPLVIGRIIDRKNHKSMSFLIAWFVDTKTF